MTHPGTDHTASRQLADTLRAQIADGAFPPGSKIPSYRQLRDSHHVALNTAYGSRVGSTPGVIGMTISGYITPDGSVASAPAPGPGPTGGGDDPTCDVHDDGKLYCGNVAGAEIYAATNSESGVVDYLRSNPSWFDCWSTGEMHDGGNTTWYHTEGDDYGQTGWTPAVNLNTSSDFDANPTAQGLQPCT